MSKLPSKKPSKLRKKRVVQYGPLWDWTKGLTQTSIELFRTCKEQFYLGVVEGWTPRAFSTPLEFGTMFHFMLERIGSAPPDQIAREVTKSYHDARKPSLDGTSYEALQMAMTNAQVLFPIYVDYYEREDAKLSWLQREHIFKIPHRFVDYNGKTQEIMLTGMRDGEYRREGVLGLFETKTKSSIDDVAIMDGLRGDFQTMLYLYALRCEYEEEPKEILYNIVRRPQLKLSTKKGETYDQYAERLAEDVKERPDWYFRRFEVTVVDGDIDVFIRTSLDPVLREFYQWWGSICSDPTKRWESPYHSRNLFGLMNKYGRCQLYNLMILGRTNEYFRRSSPFPELDVYSQQQQTVEV